MPASPTVLILSHEYPPYLFGGVGVFTKGLAEHLSRQGYRIYVIAGRSSKGFGVEKGISLNVLRVYFPDVPIRSIWYSVLSKNLILTLARKSDVIISNAASAGLAAKYLHSKRLSSKLITVFHGTIESLRVYYRHVLLNQPTTYAEDLAYYALLPFYNKLNELDAALSAKIVSVAKHVQSELCSLYPSYGEKIRRGDVVYPGIDYDTIEQVYLANEKKSDKNTIIYAYIGRLYTTKGAHYLPRVYKLIRQNLPERSELWVFGSGPLKYHLEKMAQKEKLNIKILGFVPREKLLALIAKYVDVVLFPSLYEGCPLALIEANALGVPVVAWDLPWAREFVIDSLNGFRAPFNDMEEFSNYAIKAIKLRENHPRIHNFASRFRNSVTFQKFSSLIEKFIFD